MHNIGRTMLRSRTCALPSLVRCLSSLPAHEVVGLPALSPTMQHGNLAEWKVKEGEEFGPGSELATIETDKATVSMEATDDGFVAKLLIAEGTPDIDIGQSASISSFGPHVSCNFPQERRSW